MFPSKNYRHPKPHNKVFLFSSLPEKTTLVFSTSKQPRNHLKDEKMRTLKRSKYHLSSCFAKDSEVLPDKTHYESLQASEEQLFFFFADFPMLVGILKRARVILPLFFSNLISKSVLLCT